MYHTQSPIKRRSWALTLLLLFLSFAGNANPATFRPTVDVIRPEYPYQQTVESLHAIDFRNFEFRIFNDDRKPMLTARLRHGSYKSGWNTQEGMSDDVGLNWIRFVGSSDSEYAVISLWWVEAAGSSSSYGIVQVFALQDKHPVVIQQIEFNTRNCQTAEASFAAANGVLTVKGVHGWEHCCPRTLDVVTFRWTGSRFQQRSAKSVPMSPEC